MNDYSIDMMDNERSSQDHLTLAQNVLKDDFVTELSQEEMGNMQNHYLKQDDERMEDTTIGPDDEDDEEYVPRADTIIKEIYPEETKPPEKQINS